MYLEGMFAFTIDFSRKKKALKEHLTFYLLGVFPLSSFDTGGGDWSVLFLTGLNAVKLSSA